MQWSFHLYGLPFWANGTHIAKVKLVHNQLSLTKSEHFYFWGWVYFSFCCCMFLLFCFRHKMFPLPFQLLCFLPVIIMIIVETLPLLLCSPGLLPWPCYPLAWGGLLHYNIVCHQPNGLTPPPGCFYRMIQPCSDFSTRFTIFTRSDVPSSFFLSHHYPSVTARHWGVTNTPSFLSHQSLSPGHFTSQKSFESFLSILLLEKLTLLYLLLLRIFYVSLVSLSPSLDSPTSLLSAALKVMFPSHHCS